jgi:hypothetical protein
MISVINQFGKEFDVVEAQDVIYHAQEKMMEALQSLQKYYEMTGDENTKAYITNQLVVLTHDNHDFPGSGKSLVDTLMELSELEFSDVEMMEEDGTL